jgi:tetratricopeptide (TPR) repeat protein
MSNSDHTKLNPIYAAIDAHQYSRAIKLASVLPDSNVLGSALLAHSYTKTGQKHLALITLNKVLIRGTASPSSFFELQSMLEQQSQDESSSSLSKLSSAASKVEPATVSGKKGKKGKKKPAAPKQQQQQQRQSQQPADEIQPRSDLIDRLDILPSLPEKIDVLSSLSADNQPTDIITDETTLATLAVSLKSLNLPLTAFQMYALAADAVPTDLALTKTFKFGLSFLAAPSRWSTESRSRLEILVLSHMQTVSLQLARIAVSLQDESSLMLATAWACQSAIWQLEWLPEDDQRSSILPRLAESMGMRLLKQEDDRNQRSKEISMLCLRALKRQSKWDEMLLILENIPITDSTNPNTNNAVGGPLEFGVTMSQNQIKQQTAEVLKKLDRFDDARFLYENLLQTSPDDWSCWKKHLECSMLGNNNDFGLTQTLVKNMIKDKVDSRYPLRGPHLMSVEIATERLRQDASDDALRAFGGAIRQYAETFAHRANCTFTDLDHYLSILICNENDDANKDVTVSLLEFAESLRRTNTTSGNTTASDGAIGNSNKERQAKLRAYIFALKLTHKLLSANIDLADKYLPDWVEIIREWQATLTLTSSNEGEEVRLYLPLHQRIS